MTTGTRRIDGECEEGAVRRWFHPLRRAALQRRQLGALRLAERGRPVKEMIGGVTGWLDEGFALATGEAVGGFVKAAVAAE